MRSPGTRLIQLLMAAFAASCLTPFDFRTQTIGAQLVISGQVSSLAERNFVHVGRTAGTTRLPIGMSDAVVTLLDDSGNNFQYAEDRFGNPGVYFLTGIQPIPGRTYRIRVTLPSGATYESKPERMPVNVGTDSSYYQFNQEVFTDQDGTVSTQQFINISVKPVIPATSEPIYLKWALEEVYVIVPTDFPDPFGMTPPSCYITQAVDPQNVTLFDGGAFTNNVNSDVLLGGRRLDQSFHYRHYFTTYQSSLTREAFDYWEKVDILGNQVGSIFDTPPAKIAGNMARIGEDEEVLGYFQAVHETSTRFFLVRSDLPFDLIQYCDYNSFRRFEEYPSECLNCISVPHSSFARPPWFGD